LKKVNYLRDPLKIFKSIQNETSMFFFNQKIKQQRMIKNKYSGTRCLAFMIQSMQGLADSQILIN